MQKRLLTFSFFFYFILILSMISVNVNAYNFYYNTTNDYYIFDFNYNATNTTPLESKNITVNSIGYIENYTDFVNSPQKVYFTNGTIGLFTTNISARNVLFTEYQPLNQFGIMPETDFVFGITPYEYVCAVVYLNESIGFTQDIYIDFDTIGSSGNYILGLAKENDILISFKATVNEFTTVGFFENSKINYSGVLEKFNFSQSAFASYNVSLVGNYFNNLIFCTANVHNLQRMKIRNANIIFDNSLPNISDVIVNLTNSCYTNETLNVPLNFNASDLDGDTIYYSFIETSPTLRNVFYEQNFQKDSCSGVDTFFGSEYIYTNNTWYGKSGFPFTSFLFYDFRIVQKAFSTCDYVMNIYSKPSVNFYLKPNEIISFNASFNLNFNFRDYSESFTTDYNDAYGQKKFNITYRVNNSQRLVVSKDNVEFLNLPYELDTTLSNTTLFIHSVVNMSNNMNRICVSVDLFDFYCSASFNDTSLSSIYFHDLNGVFFYINRFSFTGSLLQLNPLFTTTKPTSLNVTTIGKQLFRLYVTDNIHLTTSYIYEDIAFNIEHCKNTFNSTDLIGSASDEIPYTPQIDNEFIRGLLIFFRTPRRIFDSLGIFNMFSLMTTFFLIYISFDYWNKLQHNPQSVNQVGFSSEDILRKVVNRAFFLVTLMYLVFVLIDKTVFVISSILAMLYFGNDILKSLNLVTESTKTEKKFMLNMAFFNLASFLWFKMSNITTGVSYGFPDLPTSTVLQGDIVSWITTWITFLFNMLFFTIPEIPSVLNLFIKGLQFVSIGMFVLYLVSLLPIVNIDTGN